MKILIADDSKVMRQIVLRTMRQAGFGECIDTILQVAAC